MVCSICKGGMRVLRTDKNERRRECTVCKHRETTVEMSKSKYHRLREIVERIKSVANDVLET